MSQLIKAKLQKVSITHPEIVELKIGGLRAEHAHIEKWGWVHVPDMFTILRRIFRTELGQYDIFHTPMEIFDRFGLLCNRDGNKPLFTWVRQNEYMVDGNDHPHDDSAYIPAGWWKRIRELVVSRQKIVKVTTEIHVYNWETDGLEQVDACTRSRLGPFFRHQLVGTDVGGEKTILRVGHEAASPTKEITEVRNISLF